MASLSILNLPISLQMAADKHLSRLVGPKFASWRSVGVVTFVAAVMVAVTACGGGSGASSGSTSSQDSVRDSQLVRAFEAWWMLPPSCGAIIEASTVKTAQVGSDFWALASFHRPVNCVYSVPHSNPPATLDASEILPWASPRQPSVAVFERSASGSWEMNGAAGVPFPCPQANGAAPTFGDGDGALPAEAVSDWKMHYASGCANVVYPPEPPVEP